MKVPVCLSFLLLAAPALAQPPAPQKPVCIRASDSNDYNARPIGLHEILARNSLGHDHRAVRVMTTCTHVDRFAYIGLHSLTYCLDVGDLVTTSVPQGMRERCRVTAISPISEDYAAPKYQYR